MRLSICLHQFFDQYLPCMQGCSQHTVKAYRDTFSRFLPFAARYHHIKIESLALKHLSVDMIVSFLDHLESQCHNTARTRNLRLATLKSFAKMIRLMYPQERKIVQRIFNIPQKRIQRRLVGFLYPEEILKVYDAVDIKTILGVRDYCLLHLLYDSGARASEITALNIDYFDYEKRTLVILGKANHYRLIKLWPITADLIKHYIAKYRQTPKPLYQQRLFINQRGEELTRHGINRLCKKYLSKALTHKRLKGINPAHSFRHSCAVNMLASGSALSDIKNHLGHENVQTTTLYLHMDLSVKREVQRKFIEYTQSVVKHNSKIGELIDWENKQETLTWLDSL